jgi:hypothetical protein
MQDGNSEWMRQVIYRLWMIMQSMAFAAFNLGVYGWPADMTVAAANGLAVKVLQCMLLLWTVATTVLTIVGPRSPVLDFKHWATDRKTCNISPAPVLIVGVFWVNALLYIIGMGLVFAPAGVPAMCLSFQGFMLLQLTAAFMFVIDWVLGRIESMGVGPTSNTLLETLAVLPAAVCVFGCLQTPKFWAAVPVITILGAMVEVVNVETAFDQRVHVLAGVWVTAGVWSQIEVFKHLHIM